MSALPPTYPVSEIKIDSATQGKITNVNLYSSRAEISRAYAVTLASGQNHVVVSGLPNALDKSTLRCVSSPFDPGTTYSLDGLRVEGRGKAVIQDVTVSTDPRPFAPTTSAKLTELQNHKEDLTQSLERCTKTLGGLDRYLNSLDLKHLGAPVATSSDDGAPSPGRSAVVRLLDDYNAAAEKYDKRAAELRRQLKEVEYQIFAETQALQKMVEGNPKCLNKATVAIFAEQEGQVELVLKYGRSICMFPIILPRAIYTFPSLQPSLEPAGQLCMIFVSTLRQRRTPSRLSTRLLSSRTLERFACPRSQSFNA